MLTVLCLAVFCLAILTMRSVITWRMYSTFLDLMVNLFSVASVALGISRDYLECTANMSLVCLYISCLRFFIWFSVGFDEQIDLPYCGIFFSQPGCSILVSWNLLIFGNASDLSILTLSWYDKILFCVLHFLFLKHFLSLKRIHCFISPTWIVILVNDLINHYNLTMHISIKEQLGVYLAPCYHLN